jgi:hypothetical protein
LSWSLCQIINKTLNEVCFGMMKYHLNEVFNKKNLKDEVTITVK